MAILDPSARDAAATFFALLLDYLARRYRFSIKETGDSNGFAGLLATELRLAASRPMTQDFVELRERVGPGARLRRIDRIAMMWPALSNFCSVRVPRRSPGRC